MTLGLLVVIGATSALAPSHRMTREEFERKDRERFKDFYAQKDAKEKEAAAKISAAKEVRVKAFMKSNPSWTRYEAERHIQVEDYPAASEQSTGRDDQLIQRGCAIMVHQLERKPMSELSIKDMQQLEYCRLVMK